MLLSFLGIVYGFLCNVSIAIILMKNIVLVGYRYCYVFHFMLLFDCRVVPTGRLLFHLTNIMVIFTDFTDISNQLVLATVVLYKNIAKFFIANFTSHSIPPPTLIILFCYLCNVYERNKKNDLPPS